MPEPTAALSHHQRRRAERFLWGIEYAASLAFMLLLYVAMALQGWWEIAWMFGVGRHREHVLGGLHRPEESMTIGQDRDAALTPETMPLLTIHGAALLAMAHGKLEEAAHITALLAKRIREAEAERNRYREALREVRTLTVEVGDSVEAATRASVVAIEALDE